MKKKPSPLSELITAKKAKLPQFSKVNTSKSYGTASRIAIMQNIQRASGRRGN